MVFPLGIRTQAISIFYMSGTLIGGVGAPALFGVLIGTGSKTYLPRGCLFASPLMIGGAGMEWKFGVKASGNHWRVLAHRWRAHRDFPKGR